MVRALLLLLLLLPLLPLPAQAATLDRAVPNGWWYSQTGVANEVGFALVDDGQAKFWSEFQRLGGVDALGYPVSQRFQLDGFTVQATQRVIMQWRPEQSAVNFVNVFDRLHDLGKDGALRSTRQTPEPAKVDENGKQWEQIVRDRLAWMDGYPAIKAKYQAAIGDPIQANGLPTSQVTDVGNHFSLRAQRVVFQQWKEDVPWAKKGDVTVALGGDIAKEMGLVPADAAKPAPVPEGAAAAIPASAVQPAGPAPAPGTVDTSATRTGPLAAPADRFLLTPADFGGAAAHVVSEGAASATPRLAAAGFGVGFRRVLARDGNGKPLVALAEVDLFRDVEAARAYAQFDSKEGLADLQFRLDPLPAPAGLGEEASAFKMVDGDHAARGYVVLFRRANAVGFVALLAQIAAPTLDDAVALARAMDGRLR